jgi:hypothetical protein
MNKTSGHIKHRGMGAFLNPPTHPEHFWSVAGADFSMSLACAANKEWLCDDIRKEAKSLFDAWEPLKIDQPAVQEWISKVLGYFRDCYRGIDDEPDCWNVNNMVTCVCDPMQQINSHLGVHWIRQYYPDFVPTKEQFHVAVWS